MGKLRDDRDRHTIPLLARTRVGRALDNDVVIDDAAVSSVHASLAWRAAGSWELKDLGSRNGTFVDGERIEAGRWRKLIAGHRIAFGDPKHTFSVLDIDRPEAEARCLQTDQRVVSDGQILTLSDDPDDWIDVVEDRPGGWVIERRGRCDPVADGQEIVIDDQTWRLTLPIAEPRTEPLDTIKAPGERGVHLTFQVSSDLEHVEIVVARGRDQWRSSRAYAHALLEMARARIRDAGQGLHPDERGWLYADDLCTMAGYESDSRLNVEIHRARRDFAKFGIPNPATLIQRRRGTRQLRIGTPALEVEYLGAPPAGNVV